MGLQSSAVISRIWLVGFGIGSWACVGTGNSLPIGGGSLNDGLDGSDSACQVDADCACVDCSNPCQLQRCVDHVCAGFPVTDGDYRSAQGQTYYCYGGNPSHCGTDADCGDSFACTLDRCLNGVCSHDDAACECGSDQECPAVNTCQQATCDAKSRNCFSTPLSDSYNSESGGFCYGGQEAECLTDTQCAAVGPECAAKTCVAGVCQTDTSTCECLNNGACDDQVGCTQDLCDIDLHVCFHLTDACACLNDADCSDSDPCTTDACVANQCGSAPVAQGVGTDAHTLCFAGAAVDCLADGDCAAEIDPLGFPCAAATCTQASHTCTFDYGACECGPGLPGCASSECLSSTCQAGACVDTPLVNAPCAGAMGPGFCDSTGQCTLECVTDEHCSDQLFCTGVETCVQGQCAAGTAPCTSAQCCAESNDTCVNGGQPKPNGQICTILADGGSGGIQPHP